MLAKACTGCIESRSLLAYLARRLFLFFAFAFVNPEVEISPQHTPGIQATLALFEYQGNAETMAIHLLNHDLALGDPNEESSLFRSFWTWSIRHGYFRVGEIILNKTPLRGLVLKQDPRNILVQLASKGHVEFLKLLLQIDSVAFERKELSEALIACLTKYTTSDKMVTIALLLLQYGADANATCSEGRSTLSWACEYSFSHRLIPALLDAGAGMTIASIDSDGQTALHHAAWKHNFRSLAGLKALVDAGASLNATNKFGNTALWLAASKGCPPFVAFFLECGADVDFRGEGSTTPLMEACRYSDLMTIAMLLAEGADPNACTESDTPLISACHCQYSVDRDDLVYMLLQAGARPIMPLNFPCQPLVESVRCTRDSGGWMHEILQAAQAVGPVPVQTLDDAMRKALEYAPTIYLDGLKALVEAGGSPNTRLDPMYPGDGGAVIHYVSKSRENFRGSTRDLLRLLVESGSSLSDRDKEDRTALHVAVGALNQTAVKELVMFNSSLDAVDAKGCTAMALACTTKPTERTRYTSLDYHPDLAGSEFSGKRQAQGHRAAIISHRFEQVLQSVALEEIIHLLRESGTNPVSQDGNGLTPVHLACKGGNSIAAGVILQNRHRFQSSARNKHVYSMRDLVSARDKEGKTPLHWAACSGSVELVRMILAANSLLKFGITDEVTQEGDTKYPLHFAFIGEVVHALDDMNYTPLQYAIEGGHIDVVEIFLEEVESSLNISEVSRPVTSVTSARAHAGRKGYWRGLDCRWCAYQDAWMSA